MRFSINVTQWVAFFFFERLTVKKPEITLNYKLSGSKVKKNTLSFATVPKPVCDTFFNYTFTHEDTIHDPQHNFFLVTTITN